jgi:hypothetical protein
VDSASLFGSMVAACAVVCGLSSESAPQAKEASRQVFIHLFPLLEGSSGDADMSALLSRFL